MHAWRCNERRVTNRARATASLWSFAAAHADGRPSATFVCVSCLWQTRRPEALQAALSILTFCESWLQAAAASWGFASGTGAEADEKTAIFTAAVGTHADTSCLTHDDQAAAQSKSIQFVIAPLSKACLAYSFMIVCRQFLWLAACTWRVSKRHRHHEGGPTGTRSFGRGCLMMITCR